jgi:hypothetical protein
MLKRLGDQVVQKAGDTAAKHVTDVTTKVWKRVWSMFTSEADKVILQKFEEKPEAARALFEAELRQKLEQDPQAAEDLDQLVTAPAPDGSGTAIKIIAETVGYTDARGAEISGGIVAGMYIGQPTERTRTAGQGSLPGKRD